MAGWPVERSDEMKCPIDTGVDLVMTDRSGIEIDYCPKCRGVWLDRGELDKLIERAQADVAPEPVPQPTAHRPHVEHHQEPRDYRDHQREQHYKDSRYKDSHYED